MVCNSASSALPPGVQQATNTAPFLRQYQVQLTNKSAPWWAWGPLPPPWYQDWNMWQKGSFHKLQLGLPTSTHNPTTFQFGNSSTPSAQRPPHSPPAMYTPMSVQQMSTPNLSLRTSESSDAEPDSPASKKQES